MRRYRRILSLVAALFVCLPQYALAAGTIDKIRASKTLSLGYRQASVPFSYAGDDRQPWGYSIDLCIQVAAALVRELGLGEVQLRWLPVTPETRVEQVVSGEIDLECGSTTSSLSRMQAVDFSLPIFVDGGSFLAPSLAGLENLKDLSGRKVAVAAGTTTEKTLAAALTRDGIAAELVRVGDHQQGLEAMIEGRVDAYASDRSLLVGLVLDSGNQDRWSLATEVFSYEPYALMMRRNDADFRLVVNRELARLSRSREIHAIHERWFGLLGKPAPILESLYFLNGLPE